MSDRHVLVRLVTIISLVLILGVSMSAYGFGGDSWKEEVLLHDGSKMIVARSQTYGGYSEPASRERQLVEEVWEFTIPGTEPRVIWKSNWGRNIQDNLNLLVLGFLGNTPYIATSTGLCHAYNKWKRPNPPYIFFKFDGKVWQQISLNEFPVEFVNVNVVVGRPDQENRTGTLSVAKIKEENRHLEVYRRTILRMPLTPRDASIVGCPEPTGPDGLPIKGGFKAPFPIAPPNTVEDKK